MCGDRWKMEALSTQLSDDARLTIVWASSLPTDNPALQCFVAETSKGGMGNVQSTDEDAQTTSLNPFVAAKRQSEIAESCKAANAIRTKQTFPGKISAFCEKLPRLENCHIPVLVGLEFEQKYRRGRSFLGVLMNSCRAFKDLSASAGTAKAGERAKQAIPRRQSRYIGLCWHKGARKWIGQLRIDKKASSQQKNLTSCWDKVLRWH